MYRQLETQGYTKDQAERPDVLTTRESQEREEERRRRDLEDDRRKREMAEEEEVRRGLGGIRLQQQQQGRDRGDGVHHRNAKTDPGGRGRGRHSRNFETSESEEQSKYSSAVESDEPVEKMDWGRAVKRGSGPAPQQAPRGGGGGSRSQGQAGAMWECATCTFHNSDDRQICEMCR